MSVDQKAREPAANVGRASSSPHQGSENTSNGGSTQSELPGPLMPGPADYLMGTDFLQSCVQNPFLSMMYGMNPYINPNAAVAAPGVDVLPTSSLENPLNYWSLIAAAAMNANVGSGNPAVRAAPTPDDYPISAAAMVNLMGMSNANAQVASASAHPGNMHMPASTSATSAALAALPNLVSSFQNNGAVTGLMAAHNKNNGGQAASATPNNNLVERNGRMRMGRVAQATNASQIAFDGGFSTRYTLNLPKDRNQNDVHVKNDEHGDYLDVQCGTNNAKLYVEKLCQGSKGKAILFKGHWYSPNEFQTESGRETAKDWKRSIRHQQKSLKVMMTKRLLVAHTNDCNCGLCANSNHVPVPYSNEMSSEQTKKRRTNSGSSTSVPTSSAIGGAKAMNWSLTSTSNSSAVSPSQLSDKSDIENFGTSGLPSAVETSSTPMRSDFSKKSCKSKGGASNLSNYLDETMDYSEQNGSARKRQRLDDYTYEQMAAAQEVPSKRVSNQHESVAAAGSPLQQQYPATEFMNVVASSAFAPAMALDATSANAITSSLAAHSSYPLEQHMDMLPTQDQLKKIQNFLINSAKLHNNSNNNSQESDHSPYDDGDLRSEEKEAENKEPVERSQSDTDEPIKTEPTNHEAAATEKMSPTASSTTDGNFLSTSPGMEQMRGRSSSYPGQKKPRSRKSKVPRRILTESNGEREEMVRSAPDLFNVTTGNTSNDDQSAPATPSSTHSFPGIPIRMNGARTLSRESLLHHMPLPCVHYDSAVLERVTAKSAEMAKWDCERVCQFLDEIGCSMYRQNFMDNGVTGHSLPFLRLECLEELGVTKMHSHVIMGSIHRILGSFGIVFNGRHNYPPSSSSSCATSPPRE